MEEKKKTTGKKAGLIFLIVFLLLAILAAAGVGILYQFHKGSYGFLKGTTLNGVDVQGLSPKHLALEAADRFKGGKITVTEDEQVVLKGTLADCGYWFDQEAYEKELQERLDAQKSGFKAVMTTIIQGEAIDLLPGYSFDEKKLKEFAVSDALAVPRIKSVDAEVVMDEESGSYVVSEPVQGNTIDDEVLQQTIRDAIEEQAEKGPIKGTVKVAIPEKAYTAHEVKMDTADLEKKADEMNLELKFQVYKDTVITYTFGDQKEELTSDTFVSWLSMDKNGKVDVNKELAAAYVEELAARYNTRRVERGFNTSTGTVVYFDPGKDEYGYTIDQESETELLVSELQNAQSVSREPVYYISNSYGNPYFYGRNGVDDLNGNYVEVNLTRQHLWFYRDGNVVVESDFVSGNLSSNSGTMTGVFPLAYKESPSTLKGAGYSTKVQYWMPFYEGEGLHDASWRGAFGGEIYRTGGSNGCVNLPPNAAQTIYENIVPGMAIVIYYEPGTEPAASTYASDARNAADKVAGVSAAD
ncbi:MAG: peptidoglycan binding domain-containing protein [Eubacteriales bacterium]|nr:peptidoglycan binding domain-containing protein [Eubacteriales bacterium]